MEGEREEREGKRKGLRSRGWGRVWMEEVGLIRKGMEGGGGGREWERIEGIG